jgi:perosamine synthetase
MLAALDIGPGDEVILPALTFVATANAVSYTGATPVLADVHPDTWCIDPDDVERRLSAHTRAVLAVHLYGHPADMTALREICDGYELHLLEDAAEAPGAYWAGRPVGSLGDMAAFSFYGNKIISTGEGGMVTTNDAHLAERLRLLRGQGQDPERRYWHPVIGYNYRMTELQGAVGLAQTEDFALHLQARLRVHDAYRRFAPGLCWQGQARRAEPAYWLNVALFAERDAVAAALARAGIETRPVFYPLHHLPPYADLGPPGAYPVARHVSARGLCLPSHAGLTAEDVHGICELAQAVVAETVTEAVLV